MTGTDENGLLVEVDGLTVEEWSKVFAPMCTRVVAVGVALFADCTEVTLD